MAKEPEGKKAEEPKTDQQKLIDSWNGIVNELLKLEEMWKKHILAHKEYQHTIHLMHPLDQRIMQRILHRQIFRYFLEDIAAEGRVGFDQLLTGGRK